MPKQLTFRQLSDAMFEGRDVWRILNDQVIRDQVLNVSPDSVTTTRSGRNTRSIFYGAEVDAVCALRDIKKAEIAYLDAWIADLKG